MRVLALFSIAALTLLSGCVGDNSHRVHVRRSPEEIARDDASPKNYAELREDLKQEEELNALTGDLKRSEAYLKLKRWQIGLVTAVRGDPWENYENERREHLYKHFSDRFSAPPVIDGEPLPGEAPPPSDQDTPEGDGGEAPPADDSDDYGY